MSLQQEQVPIPQIVGAEPRDNSYFLKAFLVNDKLNGMGWKLNPAHIERNIKKFIGRPLILTDYKNHPHDFKHYKQTGNLEYDRDEFLKLQKRFEIGNIIDVIGTKNLAQGNAGNEYTAIIEVTDPNSIKSFKENRIPLYVSPSILRASGDWTDIRDFEALHLAVVDSPAFGIEVANVRQSCEADKGSCMTMLAQAGDETLKKCPYEILKTVNNLFNASQETIVPKVSGDYINSVNMNENSNVQPTETVQPKTEQVVQEQNVNDNKIADQKPEVINKDETTPIGTPKASIPEPANVNPPGSEAQREEPEEVEESPCQKAAKEYESKILELEKEIKASKEFRENYAKEQKQSKAQARLSKIDNAIPKDYANSEEERAKVIESLQKIPDAELDMFIEKFVVPATRPVKAAPRKHTEFLKNEVPVQNNAQAANDTKRSLRLRELNRVLSFTGIVPNNKKGVNS